MRSHRFYRVILSLFVLLCIITSLTGCRLKKNAYYVQENFDDYMNELFLQEVQVDSLSLNYSLAKPEKYGIDTSNATLGEYSLSQMKQDVTTAENRLSRLSDFDYSLLTDNQQLTYDIVREYLRTTLALGAFGYYNECLGPTTGIQAQLPILLAEYSFYDKEDIEKYLQLLPSVSNYFQSICEFEKEKSKQGLFMKDAVAKSIILQCEAFIADPTKNFLITYFNEKLDGFDHLSKEEKATYQAENAEAILTYVIPAYQLLINTLQELLGTGTNHQGLAYYPEGRDYYACLTRYKTGSEKSMEELIELLDTALQDGLVDITSLTLSDPKLMDKYLAFTSFPLTDPKEILADLKKDIRSDFPATAKVNCDINYIPASLSDYLSPAMYLIPPIDYYEDNDIYINGKDKKTLATIYTTLAHEGYPGHLYQCVYFRSKNPAPIRNLMDFTGYEEGWATYVEFDSYRFAGIDSSLAEFLRLNNSVILCMYARSDMGIHYEGWSQKTAIRYLNQYIADTKTSISIYNTLLEEPAIYLPYAIGYLEITELREKAEKTMGSAFRAKDFHQFILDTGPAQFDILENRMDLWLTTQMARSEKVVPMKN